MTIEPISPRLAEERDGHRVVDRVVPSAGRDVEERPAARGRSGDGARGRRHRPRAPSPSGAPSWLAVVSRPVVAAVAGPQEELGALGAEHLAGMLEQCAEGGVELRRVLEDPARLVEQLQALVLLALGDVRAIGEEHRDDGHDEQGQQRGLHPQDRDREQREAGVGDRHELPELDHLDELLELRRTAPHRDRRGDRQGADHRGRRRAGEGGEPGAQVGVRHRAAEQVEDRHRDGRDEHEVREVERELERPVRLHSSAIVVADEHGEEALAPVRAGRTR